MLARIFSTLGLLSVVFLLIAKLAPASAQQIVPADGQSFLSNDFDGQYAILQEGVPFSFKIQGALVKQTKYRIELGINARDEHLQFNLYYKEYGCSAASNDDFPGETNKNFGWLSLTCDSPHDDSPIFTITNAALTIPRGTFNFSQLPSNNNAFLFPAVIHLINNEGGGSLSELQLAIANPSKAQKLIGPNPSSVFAGNQTWITASELFPDKEYFITLARPGAGAPVSQQSGQEYYRYRLTATRSGNAVTCTFEKITNSTDNPFSLSKNGNPSVRCEPPSGVGGNFAYNAYIRIDTTDFNCFPGSSASAPCTINLLSGTQLLDSKTLTLNPLAEFRLELVGGEPVFNPPGSANDNKIPSINVYESTDAVVRALGCAPAGEADVNFKLYRDNDFTCDSPTTCTPIPGTATEDERNRKSTNGVATYDSPNIEQEVQYADYLVVATCTQDQKEATLFYRVWAKGEEWIKPQSPIQENVSWQLTLGGLEPDHCYHFSIINPLSGERIQAPSNFEFQACDVKQQDDIDGKYKNEGSELHYYGASERWGFQEDLTIGGLAAGTYQIRLYRTEFSLFGRDNDNPEAEAIITVCTAAEITDGAEKCQNDDTVGVVPTPPPPFPVCLVAEMKEGYPGGRLVPVPPNPDNEFMKYFASCAEVQTAFGPFSTNPQGFVTAALALLLSISGGIALLIIIRSGYQLMSSASNPEAIQEARERITSAIVGLLFIIFSLVVLEVIGVDILQLPGFQSSP